MRVRRGAALYPGPRHFPSAGPHGAEETDRPPAARRLVAGRCVLLVCGSWCASEHRPAAVGRRLGPKRWVAVGAPQTIQGYSAAS